MSDFNIGSPRMESNIRTSENQNENNTVLRYD